MLPTQQTIVEIPNGVQPQLSFANVIEESVFVTKPVAPAQAPFIDAVGLDVPQEFQMDIDFYATDQLMPAEYAEIANVGVMRGRNLVVVRVNPIKYNPVTGEIRVCKSCTISVSWEDTLNAMAETDNAMDVIANAMVLNFQPATQVRATADKYLIVTVPELEANANEFASFKMTKGFDVTVEVLDLNPDKDVVKATIQKYYPAVKYVLIIADNDQIILPRTVKHPYNSELVPSDLYYACLEGEDYYPDIYIGRVPANTPEEATLLLGKIMNYEAKRPTGDWIKRFLLCGEFQYTYSQKNVAQRLFCETAYTIWNSLKDRFVFPTQTIGAGASGLGYSEYYFSPNSYRSKILANNRMPEEWWPNIVSDAIAKENTLAFWEEGACIIQHRDHGGETLWGKPSINKANVANLQNGDKLPVLFSINCLTGYLDYKSGDCFVEAALKNPNGGAVSAIAATRISYSWHNDRFCDGLYTCIFGPSVFDPMDEGVKLPVEHPCSQELGVMLNYAKMYLEKNDPRPNAAEITELTFYLFHCMGDPSMKIWLD